METHSSWQRLKKREGRKDRGTHHPSRCFSHSRRAPAPGSAPDANRTPFRIHSNADNGPGSRPLLGTEWCHGGDDGLCLAGCESIRCAGSTAAESSLKEKKVIKVSFVPLWCGRPPNPK
ncbi:uncharacterized protein LOC143660358 [Tamandua tetradactyla]|uniref:uncharacterized protein LOC143660358 n=1 Tax=Tamandua tetradactyla TaxID=48850 RepID=UPI004053BD3E